ncbi:hypothetical protein B7463_g303, partial [Scytalidium lignicola]
MVPILTSGQFISTFGAHLCSMASFRTRRPTAQLDKVAFFEKLDALANSSDNEQAVVERPRCSGFLTKDTANTSNHGSILPMNKTSLSSSEIIPEQPKERRALSDAKMKATSRKSVEKTSSLGKRKRKESSINLVPEDQQIFRGLIFYYIPPNDIAKQRRVQITRAREYGALWEKEFTAKATHIIVDKNLTYQDVMKYLGLEKVPPGIIMTNENYPIDCISFRTILNHKQRQYFVRGQPDLIAEKQLLPLATQNSSSLPIKQRQSKPGKWDYVPPRSKSLESSPVEHNKDHHESSLFYQSSGDSINKPLPLVESPIEGSTPKRNPQDVAPIHTQNQDDELEEMIKSAKGLEHLPLDDDEDSRPSSRDESNNGDDSSDDDMSLVQRRSSKSKSKRPSKGAFNQENFSCMKGGTGITPDSNPNAHTISILQEMSDYYSRINDTWRPRAYRMAIGTLRRQTTKIMTAEQAAKLPFVGERLALKIEEIAQTDRLRKLDNTKSDPSDKVLQLFLNIYGVGLSQASRWVEQGYKTLEDVKAHASLSENQRMGIDRYDDLNTRIPREEVAALGNVVEHYANLIDPAMRVIIGGSYRRGASSSGDIDCLLTKPGTSSSRELVPFLNELIDKLTEVGFVVAALTHSGSNSKWHGCCVLPGSKDQIWRRIDFLLVPDTELGAALIYFTGDDIFNRSIRLLASRKGFRLNQRGLWKDIMRGPQRQKITQGSLLEGADEKKIFSLLGVPWRPPEQRICQ